MFSGLQDTLNDALKDIKEKAVQKTLQVGIEQEATAMKNIGEAENNFKIVKNIDEPIKNLQYDVYLKHLMIEYLETKYKLNQENNSFRIIEDVNQALNSIPNNRYTNLTNKKYDNSILIGIPVVLLQGTGGNTDFTDSENFNFIICQGNCSENNFEKSFLNKYTDKNKLENYKANTTIKNIEEINDVLNTDKLFTNFEQTKLYENLVGKKSIFSDIGYHPNNLNSKNDISYVYFRINFESSITCNDKIEHFDTPEYIHFILQKYNLTSKELDNKINKNKELILIEQNKYNIKAGIFKILKYISIILTILFIFIVGYYSIGKEKINEVIANVTKNNKISNKTNNKMNNRTNNSLKFIKK